MRRNIAENGYNLFVSKLRPVALTKELIGIAESEINSKNEFDKKCYLCGSNFSKFLFYGKDRLHKIDKKLFEIRKCLNCGLVYLYPQPGAEELKKYYPPDYGPYQNNDSPLKYGPISRAIKNFFNHIWRPRALSLNKKENPAAENKAEKEGCYFMDFGCGSGLYLEKMRRMHPNWHLYGFDNSETACENTRAKGFEVRCGDFMSIDYPKNNFDIIYMGHVVEHLNDPRAVLAKINGLLKLEGELMIITPNFDSLSEKVFGTYWFAMETPRHLFLFDKRTLALLLKETGFVVESVEYSNDVRVAIKSLNYLFDRKDMRINFVVWHLLWFIFKPISNLLVLFGKTSIMTIRAKKIR